MSDRVKKTFKSVNNKRIVSDIDLFVEEAIREFSIQWDSESQRQSLVEILEDFLYDTMSEEKSITGFKVVCDRRNNRVAENEDGVYRLDIHFNQINCLNTTQLNYIIDTTVSLLDIDEDVDYVI